MKPTAPSLLILAAALVAAAVVGVSLLGADAGGAAARDPRELVAARAMEVPGEPIQPIPAVAAEEPALVELGRQLFADHRLSQDGSLACASCHRPDRGGADERQYSLGVGGQPTAVNVPTVRNSRFSLAQFWDGRAATLEDQAEGPLLNPAEMAMTWDEAMARLQADPGYPQAAAALGAALSPELVRTAIAAYERTLVSAGSRFDAFLRGDTAALTAEEQAGYRLFKEYGCASCHQGVAVGGNLYQRLGQFGDYFADRGGVGPADYGRFNVTGDEADRFVFKVPSLREVANTAPYFHDGSAATLEEAISVMGRYQLGRLLRTEEVGLIAQFLRTLAGAPAGAS
jgi:cytochrome c peroxidase